MVVGANRSVAITIDDFSDGSILLVKTTSSGVTAQQTGLDPAHVVGGGRNLIVDEFGGVGQTLSIDAALGEFQFYVPSGALGYFTIAYGNPSQPLNLDLTAQGASALLMHMAFNPPLMPFMQRPFDYPPNTLRLVTAGGDGSTTLVAADVVTTLQSDGTYLARIPFSSFGPGIDLTDVDQFDFEMFRLSRQVKLLGITAVPEPAAWTLAAAAALCARLIRLRPSAPLARLSRQSDLINGQRRTHP
jgi:hypothetical protein